MSGTRVLFSLVVGFVVLALAGKSSRAAPQQGTQQETQQGSQQGTQQGKFRFSCEPVCEDILSGKTFRCVISNDEGRESSVVLRLNSESTWKYYSIKSIKSMGEFCGRIRASDEFYANGTSTCPISIYSEKGSTTEGANKTTERVVKRSAGLDPTERLKRHFARFSKRLDKPGKSSDASDGATTATTEQGSDVLLDEATEKDEQGTDVLDDATEEEEQESDESAEDTEESESDEEEESEEESNESDEASDEDSDEATDETTEESTDDEEQGSNVLDEDTEVEEQEEEQGSNVLEEDTEVEEKRPNKFGVAKKGKKQKHRPAVSDKAAKSKKPRPIGSEKVTKSKKQRPAGSGKATKSKKKHHSESDELTEETEKRPKGIKKPSKKPKKPSGKLGKSSSSKKTTVKCKHGLPKALPRAGNRLEELKRMTDRIKTEVSELLNEVQNSSVSDSSKKDVETTKAPSSTESTSETKPPEVAVTEKKEVAKVCSPFDLIGGIDSKRKIEKIDHYDDSPDEECVLCLTTLNDICNDKKITVCDENTCCWVQIDSSVCNKITTDKSARTCYGTLIYLLSRAKIS